MRYTVSRSVVRVIGRIWMPSITGAQEITLSGFDVDDARDDDGRITRESVQRWVDTHAGDFAEVIDFYASIEDDGRTIEIPWERGEESEQVYTDCMIGGFDDI